MRTANFSTSHRVVSQHSCNSSSDVARPICTFFAMGGCSKGEHCPYSHELVQVAPHGVDVSGGFYICGNVANYRAATSGMTSTTTPTGGETARSEDPTQSSSSICGTSSSSTVSPPSTKAPPMQLNPQAREFIGANAPTTTNATGGWAGARATTSSHSVQSGAAAIAASGSYVAAPSYTSSPTPSVEDRANTPSTNSLCNGTVVAVSTAAALLATSRSSVAPAAALEPPQPRSAALFNALRTPPPAYAPSSPSSSNASEQRPKVVVPQHTPRYTASVCSYVAATPDASKEAETVSWVSRSVAAHAKVTQTIIQQTAPLQQQQHQVTRTTLGASQPPCYKTVVSSHPSAAIAAELATPMTIKGDGAHFRTARAATVPSHPSTIAVAQTTVSQHFDARAARGVGNAATTAATPVTTIATPTMTALRTTPPNGHQQVVASENQRAMLFGTAHSCTPAARSAEMRNVAIPRSQQLQNRTAAQMTASSVAKPAMFVHGGALQQQHRQPPPQQQLHHHQPLHHPPQQQQQQQQLHHHQPPPPPQQQQHPSSYTLHALSSMEAAMMTKAVMPFEAAPVVRVQSPAAVPHPSQQFSAPKYFLMKDKDAVAVLRASSSPQGFVLPPMMCSQ